MATVAAVSAIVVAGAASAGCSERTSTRSCPSPHAASASAATSSAVRAVVAANTTAIMASRLRSAAVSPRLTSCSSASSRSNVSALGSPPTRRVAAAWNSSPRTKLPIEITGRLEDFLAGGDRSRHARRRGSAPSRGRAPRSRARSGCSTGAAPAPCGRPPRACARPTRPRRGRAGSTAAREVGASSSSARRRKRTAWSAEPRLLACRAEAVSASNAHCSPTGPAGPAASRWAAARSHRAGSRASSRAAARCSCTRSAGGIESWSACWMIGWTNLGGRPGCRSSASIKASTASAAALRSTPATSAVSAREASSPRIASVCATAPTVGERRLSRAATNRATDGGPMAAIAPASTPPLRLAPRGQR